MISGETKVNSPKFTYYWKRNWETMTKKTRKVKPLEYLNLELINS